MSSVQLSDRGIIPIIRCTSLYGLLKAFFPYWFALRNRLANPFASGAGSCIWRSVHAYSFHPVLSALHIRQAYPIDGCMLDRAPVSHYLDQHHRVFAW